MLEQIFRPREVFQHIDWGVEFFGRIRDKRPVSGRDGMADDKDLIAWIRCRDAIQKLLKIVVASEQKPAFLSTAVRL